jgi:predicted PurR-regulated permease PerM
MSSVAAPAKRGSELSILVSLITAVIVIAALYLGREILIPFALALLLSFLLAPPITWLEKRGAGRIPSVLLVLTIAFSALSAVLYLGTIQLADIAGKLPRYQDNIHRKLAAMRNPAGYGWAKAANSLREIGAELSSNNADAENRKTAAATSEKGRPRSSVQQSPGPVPVEVVKHPPGILDSLGLIGTSLFRFFGVAAAVLIFTLFMLLQHRDLRDRFFRLLGSRHLNVTTTALDDAASRISRYLLTEFMINAAFGLLLSIGLYWIGVPNAPFWGVLAAILRFIPYVGASIAGLCPLLLALAVFEGWARPMLTLGLFAALEFTMSAAIEPWLCGARTGISSLAILVSAAFWTLLWGPIGLVLSTPFTVCLLVLGKYVPALNFLNILLGDQEVLPPEAGYYQRLLAMDEDGAQEIVQNYLKEKTFGELCDSVLIPALALAEQDRHQNALDADREAFVYRSTRDLIEDLAEQISYESPPTTLEISPASRRSVLCIPARDEADQLVGRMLIHLLRQSGYTADTVPLGTMEEMSEVLQRRPTGILFISALPPFAMSRAKVLCRRVRRVSPDLEIVMGLWGSAEETNKMQDRLGPDCFNNLVTSLGQAQSQLQQLAEASATKQAAIVDGSTVMSLPKPS